MWFSDPNCKTPHYFQRKTFYTSTPSKNFFLIIFQANNCLQGSKLYLIRSHAFFTKCWTPKNSSSSVEILHPPQNRTFFGIKQTHCFILAINQLLTIPASETSEGIAYSEEVFLQNQRHKRAISRAISS